MKPARPLAAAAAVALLALGGATLAQDAAKPAPQPPAGSYVLDKSHASVVFRVNHLGFSRYTAQFSRFDAKLKFDPANPAAMEVEATIDPTSLTLPAPPAGFLDKLLDKTWLDAAAFPQITFRSTKVELTGAQAARVTGDLTLHGVTKPVTLDVTYNGGWPPNSFDPGGARVGFSAHGTFKRSAFGITTGIPAAGSSMGVSDDVEVDIEVEFSSKPPAKQP